MTYRLSMDLRGMATPPGVPGRPLEVPANPPGPPGGPDIRPPPPEVPDIPTPAEAPILDPPLAPTPSPPIMLGAAIGAVLRRVGPMFESAMESFRWTWPPEPIRAPLRVVATSRRSRRQGN